MEERGINATNGRFLLSNIIFVIVFNGINLIFMLLNSSDDILIDFTFILNYTIISIFLSWIIMGKRFEPFNITFCVFNYLFFFIAPVIQTNNGFYPNTMPFSKDLIVKTNLSILLFNLSYCFTYCILFSRSSDKRGHSRLIISKNIFYIMLGISLLAFLMFYKYNLNIIMYRTRIYDLDTSSNLIINKFIFSGPIFLVAYLLLYKNQFKNKALYLFLLIISVILLLWFKNPFIEKRNAIGPVYLTILMILLRKVINNNLKFLLLMIMIMVFLFPLSSLITHSQLGLQDFISEGISNKINLSKEFIGLDYDAWSNFMATIDYVDNYYITYGRQLLGVLTFFIPRSIWPAKPIGSGALIGNYLMNNYSMWFNNLSNPFVSESYLNFGVIGVIMFAVLLGIISFKVNMLCNDHEDIRWVIGTYISIHLIYLLRGDLMSSFAYLIGVLAMIYYLPLFLMKLQNLLNSRSTIITPMHQLNP